MINIQSFNYTEFAGKYEQGSVEAQALEELSNSAETFSYASAEALEFELTLRRETVMAAGALSRSRMAFAVFENTRCNPDFWIRASNGGFNARSDVRASDAVGDIFTNSRMYATECATAMVIIYYGALLKVYGGEKFNSTFKDIYLMNWSIRDPLLRKAATPLPTKSHIVGDRVYFANPDVDPETPWWQGENVIVLPGGEYYGHGVGVLKAEEIVRLLNGQRREGATRPAYLMDSAGRPDFAKLYNAYVGRELRPSSLVWRPFPPPITARA